MVGLLVVSLTVQVSLALTAAPTTSISIGDLGECFAKDEQVNSTTSNSTYLMAFGITNNCYVYYGLVTEFWDIEKDLPGGDDKKCKDKEVFRVRTYGETQELIIVVDRFGRRVRVQPALSKKPFLHRNETNGTLWSVWHYVNTSNRLGQFYSDSVDRGFVIAGFYYFKSRVLVYAVSHYAVRFYDLRLHIGNNYITPYLDLVSEPPLRCLFPHPQMKIMRRNRTDPDSEEIILYQGDGQVYSTHLKEVVALPFCNPSNSRRPISEERNPFSDDPKCSKFGQPLLFPLEEKIRPDYWMLMVSTRRWVNPMHAHRRMSYPHAVRRMKHHHFFTKGWARALPIVVANILILLVGTLVFLRLVSYYNREYRKRRLGADSSFSVMTHQGVLE
ncbi:hypothetical protein V3C99_008538 [Haemonchus contortus]